MDLQDVLARQESPFPSCLIADLRDCFLLVLVLVPVIVLDDGNHLWLVHSALVKDTSQSVAAIFLVLHTPATSRWAGLSHRNARLRVVDGETAERRRLAALVHCSVEPWCNLKTNQLQWANAILNEANPIKTIWYIAMLVGENLVKHHYCRLSIDLGLNIHIHMLCDIILWDNIWFMSRLNTLKVKCHRNGWHLRLHRKMCQAQGRVEKWGQV
jgi:hypothetical protein